ncbi:hypothetical protein DH2020_049807 [Rehmannia glutinosa]|uniref:Glycosyl hydrolase family 31 C-terminal domain-containing protein n=1 Tax=Rehmannia glutinosa TaxID=99300 RepID=A0ABR0U1I8_REHGL
MLIFTLRDKSFIGGNQRWRSLLECLRNEVQTFTLFLHSSYEAHVTGAPIARPLFFTFTNETELYGLSTQFLLGRSLMVSPVLESNKTQVEAMFPRGTWYDMFDMTKVVYSKESRYVVLDAPLHVINVHLYENAIIPMQQGGLISKEARMTPFTLVVAFPLGATNGESKGNLFLDDDELPEMRLGDGYATYVDFYATVSKGSVKVWSDVQESKFALEKGWTIEKVIVLGLNGNGNGSGVEIEVDGNGVADSSKVEVSSADHEYVVELEEDGENKMRNVMVEVKGLELPVGKNFAMSWKMGIKA